MKIVLKGAVIAFALGMSGIPVMASDQHECHDDAFRLCAAVIPDEGKIHACLVHYAKQLSPRCRAIIQPRSQPRHHKKKT